MAPRKIYLRLCFQSRETKEGSPRVQTPGRAGREASLTKGSSSLVPT